MAPVVVVEMKGTAVADAVDGVKQRMTLPPLRVPVVIAQQKIRELSEKGMQMTEREWEECEPLQILRSPTLRPLHSMNPYCWDWDHCYSENVLDSLYRTWKQLNNEQIVSFSVITTTATTATTNER